MILGGVALLLAARPARAQLEPGDIGLTGYVKWKNTKTQQFVLSVRSFTLPNGRRNKLVHAKDKVIIVGADTAIISVGAAPKLTLADISIGKPVYVVGEDTGTGKPLRAKEVDLLGRIVGK